MPIDEVLMRDSCGKSRSQIKKYFYYNEYSSDNFPFKSDFEELTLLDLIEGKKSFSDVIPLFIPSFILILLAIACIGIWISICVCSVKPKCFCKKDNKNTSRTRFICLMVFFGFALCIITLAIVILVYIKNAEYDFNGTICSLLMFQYQIMNGQGFLCKKPMYKPYWYGSNGINTEIERINSFMEELKSTCNGNLNDLSNAYSSCDGAQRDFKHSLGDLYDQYKDAKITLTDPTSQEIQTIPIYISKLGPIVDNKTYIGKIGENYDNNFHYILEDILHPVIELCTILDSGGDHLTNSLAGFESVIDDLNSMLDNLSSKITEYITEYSGLIINFGFKVNLALFIIIVIVIFLQGFLYIFYYFNPFSLIKNTLYIIIHLINFILILCFIYNGIFSILSIIMGNMADIVDAALSKENLSSETPRLINAGDDINKLTRCLRGDGNLFDEFVNEDVKNIVDPLTQLYSLYSPVKEVNIKLSENENNEYNSLITLDETIEELENMKDDFILSTTKETSNNNDIGTMFDELNKYTMAGRRYQQQCVTATYDIWTTNEEHCTQVQADINIITGQCKYLNEFYDKNDHAGGAARASSHYDNACSLINTNYFPDVKTAVYKYVFFFNEYKDKNIELIDNILQNTAVTVGLNTINSDFKTKFIDNMKNENVIPLINSKITGPVHDLFSELLNDTTIDTRQLKDNFDLFSWMNCLAIGQDYNATLSTLKSNLTEEMRDITYCSLVCEILIIATLYIMLGLNKNLRDKIFEINDERNVSHSSDNVEEIEIESNTNRKSEKNADEIYNVKNKKSFQVVKDIDKRRGIDVKDKKNLDKNGKGIEHPVMVSINGPSGKPLFTNGENGESAHNKMNKDKNYYKTNSETEEELTSSEGDKDKNSNKKSKEGKEGKETIAEKENNEDENEEEEEDDENEEEEGNGESKDKKDQKNKKIKNDKNKEKKSSKNKKSNKKKESQTSSSVSFG